MRLECTKKLLDWLDIKSERSIAESGTSTGYVCPCIASNANKKRGMTDLEHCRSSLFFYTVIPAMYLICPMALRSACAYLAVRAGTIFLIILGYFVKKGSSFSVLPQF